MTSFSANPRPNVLFVVFPGTKLLDVAGPLQVFADAQAHGGAAYDTHLVSLEGGEQMTDTGVALATQALADWEDRPIHTLLVAGGIGARRAAALPGMTDIITRLAQTTERMGSICTGAFVLAAAGLLNGRRAVTHWESCGCLAEAFPEVKVEPDQIYVRDDPIWTSAGVTAGIDMALAMIAQDSGRKTAMALARSLVTFIARPGGQSQFSTTLSRQTEDADGRFDALHAWIAENLSQDLRVERLAEQAGMSARNFARLYRQHTGQTPAKTVESFRVTAARNRLEETDEPIGMVARRTGFVDDERLRRAMQRATGSSPSDYRERFSTRAD